MKNYILKNTIIQRMSRTSKSTSINCFSTLNSNDRKTMKMKSGNFRKFFFSKCSAMSLLVLLYFVLLVRYKIKIL